MMVRGRNGFEDGGLDTPSPTTPCGSYGTALAQAMIDMATIKRATAR